MCNFTITVTDDEIPRVVCPADVVLIADAGRCSTEFQYATTSTDNCHIASEERAVFNSEFAVGSSTQAFQATDDAGNVAFCSFMVNVVDEEQPMVSCPNNIQVLTDAGKCSAMVTYQGSITDNCHVVAPVDNWSLLPGSEFLVGETLVSYNGHDASNNMAVPCTFTVTVTDGQDPMITCPGDVTMFTDAGLCTANVQTWGLGPTETDNCGVAQLVRSIISRHSMDTVFDLGQTEEIMKTVDLAGNSDTCAFIVSVVDNQKPVVTCPPNQIVQIGPTGCTKIVSYMGVATDNCHVQSESWSIPSGSDFTVGETVVTYTAMDAAGNMADPCSFTVTVLNEVPTVTCPSDMLVDIQAGRCSATVFYTSNTSNNCPLGITTTWSKASGSEFAVGETVVTYTAMNSAGNSNTCSFKVVVVLPVCELLMAENERAISSEHGINTRLEITEHSIEQALQYIRNVVEDLRQSTRTDIEALQHELTQTKIELHLSQQEFLTERNRAATAETLLLTIMTQTNAGLVASIDELRLAKEDSEFSINRLSHITADLIRASTCPAGSMGRPGGCLCNVSCGCNEGFEGIFTPHMNAPYYDYSCLPINPFLDCVLGVWGEFSDCSKSCGSGMQSRTRQIMTEPMNGGMACAATSEQRLCNSQGTVLHVSSVLLSCIFYHC